MCQARIARGRLKAGAFADALPGFLRAAIDLKATLNYHMPVDTAAKIDLLSRGHCRGKTNRKRLIRLQGQDKLGPRI